MADTPLNISTQRWLDTIETEYLTDYVRTGGSAVKVISGSDATLGRVALAE